MLKRYKERVDEIQNFFDNPDIDYDKIEKLEEEICDIEYEISGFPDSDELDALLRKIAKIKEENEMYDADSILDMMFPNGFDDDCDDDSVF